MDRLKEQNKRNLDEEISKVQKLQYALKATEDKLSDKEGQIIVLAEKVSTLQCQYNEQGEVNNVHKSRLLEESNSPEDSLRYKAARYYIYNCKSYPSNI